MGKEKIIKSIISDAEKLSENLLSDAKQVGEDIIKQAELTVAKITEEAQRETANRRSGAEKHGEKMAELELGKSRLALKQRFISQSFDAALQKLSALPQKDYLAIISGLLKNAQNGDTVIITKKDKDIITQEFLNKNSKNKLTLSKEYGAFKGGIKLVNSEFERNFSLEVLLLRLREEIEPQLAKILFS